VTNILGKLGANDGRRRTFCVWRGRGGGRYPQGPAAVPEGRLLRIEVAPEEAHAGPRAQAEIRPLDQLRAYRDLSRGASPPWE
jgi:hypothetical protein